MENKTNAKAIIALTLGILSIFIPVIGIVLGTIGFIFSLIAKKEIEKTKEQGVTLAKAGMILSIIGLIVQFFMIAVGVVSFLSVPVI